MARTGQDESPYTSERATQGYGMTTGRSAGTTGTSDSTYGTTGERSSYSPYTADTARTTDVE